jgi:SAM-dependent methyltransferase
MWDQRYAGKDYLFGTEPAEFVAAQANVLPPGARVLCLADGEGRNSVHLAALGHAVTAMDPSPVALAKARALAASRGVAVDFRQAGVEEWDWSQPFDAILGVFIQFAPPALRTAIHKGIAQAVTPGGLALLHGYAPRQIANGTGGPRAVENLYTLDGLAADFPGWQVLHAADYDKVIQEGSGHSGPSALIDFIARKPAQP